MTLKKPSDIQGLRPLPPSRRKAAFFVPASAGFMIVVVARGSGCNASVGTREREHTSRQVGARASAGGQARVAVCVGVAGRRSNF